MSEERGSEDKTTKKYGLVIKSKVNPNQTRATVTQSKPNVFSNPNRNDDSNSEDDHEEKTIAQVNRNLKKRQKESLQSQSVQMTIQNALEQDSSVFQYDEIYDSMKENQKKKVEEKKEADGRSSKYAADLIRAAEKRKVMNELRVERTVQKERQAEGSQFADKECFISESYKKKLAERAEMEKEIKREDALEARRNPKQEFSGFYRNYLDKVCRDGSESVKLEVKKEDEEIEDNSDVKNLNGADDDDAGADGSRSKLLEQADSLANIKEGGLILPFNKTRQRQRPSNIRKRSAAPSSCEQNIKQEAEEESSDEENSQPASKIRHQMQYNNVMMSKSKKAKSEVSDSKLTKTSAAVGGNGADSDNESSTQSGSSSSVSEDEGSEGGVDVEKEVPVYKPLPQVVLKDAEEERKEMIERRIETILKIFQKRNDQESIEQCRQRYFARRKAGLIKPVYYKE